MTANSKPSILLLHGAYSTPAVWNRLVPYLEQAGYSTLTATFPSSNSKNPHEDSAENDATHVRDKYLLPLIENENKDILLVLHSYAGVVGPAAAVGLSKTTRSAQNLKGGIVGIMCIAANLVHQNSSLLEAAGGQFPPWFQIDTPRAGLAVIDPLMETVCHDCDPALEPEIRKAIVPQAYACFASKAPSPCWIEDDYAHRLAFIRAIQDRVNPVFAQDLWLEGTGVRWEIVSMDTSHSPILSQPERVAEYIFGFAEKFNAL